MPWDTSNRRDRLPKDWAHIRLRILKRDGYACKHMHSTMRRCGRPANQVDHIIPGDDHNDANLQALCSWHHSRKSSAEGHAAYSYIRKPLNRPEETHPADR